MLTADNVTNVVVRTSELNTGLNSQATVITAGTAKNGENGSSGTRIDPESGRTRETGARNSQDEHGARQEVTSGTVRPTHISDKKIFSLHFV